MQLLRWCKHSFMSRAVTPDLALCGCGMWSLVRSRLEQFSPWSKDGLQGVDLHLWTSVNGKARGASGSEFMQAGSHCHPFALS